MEEKQEIGFLRVMAEYPSLGLSEADVPQIAESLNELDISNINSITQYGIDTQRKMAELSQVIINNLNDSSIDQVDDLLRDTIQSLCDINDEDGQEKRGFFRRRRQDPDQTRKRYDEAAKNVDKIAATLEEHQIRLIRDCALLNQVFEMNREYHHQTGVKIAAVKLKASELRERIAHSDAGAVDESWMNAILDRLERKASEMEMSRAISVQQSAQIRMLQTNFALMADKLQSTLFNTIPLWKGQIVLALGAEHARQAVITDKSISDMTNRLLLKNAESLKLVTAETQRAAGTGTIDVHTLAETNRILIDSLDEVIRIQSENRTNREAAEKELVRIENEMHYGMITDKNDV